VAVVPQFGRDELLALTLEAKVVRARILTAEKLTELAAAVAARFGKVKVTQCGGGDSPFSPIAQVLGSVLALAKDA